MTFKSKRALRYAVYAIVILAVLVFVFMKFSQGKKCDVIQVGIRSAADGVYDDAGMRFVWEVENSGKHRVCFKEGDLASMTINGDPYIVDVEAAALEPGETYCVEMQIPYPVARDEGTNTVVISATTENGTKATYRTSFRH